jgi:hypothetical protein
MHAQHVSLICIYYLFIYSTCPVFWNDVSQITKESFQNILVA